MGHFTISLPDNKQGDVTWGKLRKLGINLNLFSKAKPEHEAKTGYIVRVAPNDEYRLFKSKNGKWSEDPECKIALNDEWMLSIQKAIIEKENERSSL
jgi:hypothetical protein